MLEWFRRDEQGGGIGFVENGFGLAWNGGVVGRVEFARIAAAASSSPSSSSPALAGLRLGPGNTTTTTIEQERQQPFAPATNATANNLTAPSNTRLDIHFT